MQCFFAKAVVMAVATSLVLLIASSQARAHSYTVVDLGVFNTTSYNGGNYSEAWGISENGNITGLSSFKVTGPPFPNSDDHRPNAFLWTPTTTNGTAGTMLNLKALGWTQGSGYRDSNTSIGMSVNNDGIVVGANFNSGVMYANGDSVMNYDSYSHAIICVPNATRTDSSIHDLGVFQTQDGGGYSSGAWGITNSGIVYGGSNYNVSPFAGYEMGFTYAATSSYPALNMSTNGVSGTHRLLGANEFSQAVGHTGTDAVLYSGGVVTNLGQFGGNNAQANGISNSGIVVGTTTSSTNFKIGFVWTPDVANGNSGTYVLISPYFDAQQRQWNVVPKAVNSSGTVVGYIWRADEDGRNLREAAFSWKANTGMLFLDTTMSSMPLDGWERTRANDINDLGQIVGFGQSILYTPQNYAYKYGRAFLLQP